MKGVCSPKYAAINWIFCLRHGHKSQNVPKAVFSGIWPFDGQARSIALMSMGFEKRSTLASTLRPSEALAQTSIPGFRTRATRRVLDGSGISR